MVYAKTHSSYISAFGNSNETKSNIIESTKKSIFQLVDFIIKSFGNSNELGLVTIQFEDFNKFKFYQQINRDLLESCMSHRGGDGASLLKKVDTYIACNYLTIILVSKTMYVTEDIANNIFSHFDYPSLLAIDTTKLYHVAQTGEYITNESLGS
jgi:hypothetical protein